MATRLKRVNATALIHTGPARIKSIVLTPAAAVATLTIDDSLDGSGTDALSLQAAASGNSAVWRTGDQDGAYVSIGIHATLAGAGALVTIEYEGY